MRGCTYATAAVDYGRAEDPERLAMIGFAKEKSIPLIPIRLDRDAEWPQELKDQLNGQEEILADGLSAAGFQGR